MTEMIIKEKEMLYQNALEKILGKEIFHLEVEDYEMSKFIVVSKMNGHKEAPSCLFITLNKQTGKARGYTSERDLNSVFFNSAEQIKRAIEEAYVEEKQNYRL